MMHILADPEFWVLLAVLVFIAIVWKPMRRFIVGTLDQRAMRIEGELEMRDARAGTMTCPTSRHHPLCGSVDGRTRTAVLPDDATGVVLVQVDRG